MNIITETAEYHIINFKKKVTVKEITDDLMKIVDNLKKNNVPVIKFHNARLERDEQH